MAMVMCRLIFGAPNGGDCVGRWLRWKPRCFRRHGERTVARHVDAAGARCWRSRIRNMDRWPIACIVQQVLDEATVLQVATAKAFQRQGTGPADLPAL